MSQATEKAGRGTDITREQAVRQFTQTIGIALWMALLAALVGGIFGALIDGPALGFALAGVGTFVGFAGTFSARGA